MSSQLPLGLNRDGGFTLDNFYAGPNAHALQVLQTALEAESSAQIVLEGEPGVGKTHLLQALWDRCAAGGRRVAYLPLRAADEEFTTSALQGLEKLRNVFLDDVDAIAGLSRWESELAERLLAKPSGALSVLMSSSRPRGEIPFEHPELQGYFRRCRVMALKPVPDGDRVQALLRHAEGRGLRLAEDVARYLMRQVPGGLGDWVRALDALDYASLANKRRLTKPFIRSVLKLPG